MCPATSALCRRSITSWRKVRPGILVAGMHMLCFDGQLATSPARASLCGSCLLAFNVLVCLLAGEEVNFNAILEASNVCGLLKRTLRKPPRVGTVVLTSLPLTFGGATGEQELPIDPLTARRLLKAIDRSHSHAQRLRRVRR